MKPFKGLNREQKEAVGLLQIGTFLEYFDLMLYMHMAVLLNELFFPKTDPHTANLLAAFAFCSTYVLRPFGALVFGYIGDNIGRKATVIITTMMMSLSCIVMANLPTYAQIGISAAWLVTICRIVQGMSSMGEIMGAMIYITEIVKRPMQFPMVTMIALSASVGAMFALAVSVFVTQWGLEWRIAFWMGACIAVVGSVARTRLRETPEFLNAQKSTPSNETPENLSDNQGKSQNWMDLLAYFCVECSYALNFYLVFMYFNPFLKSLGFTPPDIILHNFYLSLVCIAFNILMILMSMKIHPLKIIKFRASYGLIVFLLVPYFVTNSTAVWQISLIQFLLLLYRGGATPADSIFIQRFKVRKRFTLVTFNYALSRACVHIISAFGLIYLTVWLGNYGILIIIFPVAVGYFWGVSQG